MADDLDQIVDNLKQPVSWIRVVFMIGFAILLYVIIAPVIFVLMIVQALFVLIAGECNANLKLLGAALAQYVLQILLFISYNSELRPFPFSDFPPLDEDGEEADAEADDAAKRKRTKRKTAAKKKSASRKTASDKKSGSNTGSQDDGTAS